jgi:hypothetical protein
MGDDPVAWRYGFPRRVHPPVFIPTKIIQPSAR